MTDSFSSTVNIYDLLFSAVWIIGFSIVFAALSHHHYKAQTISNSFRQQLQTVQFQFPLWLGLSLVSLGFTGTANTVWERVVWGGLTVLSMIQLYFSAAEFQSQRTESNN